MRRVFRCSGQRLGSNSQWVAMASTLRRKPRSRKNEAMTTLPQDSPRALQMARLCARDRGDARSVSEAWQPFFARLDPEASAWLEMLATDVGTLRGAAVATHRPVDD